MSEQTFKFIKKNKKNDKTDPNAVCIHSKDISAHMKILKTHFSRLN